MALCEKPWALTHVGFRDDLDLLRENGFLETRYKPGNGFIAFRILPNVELVEEDGFPIAVRK